MHSSFASRLLVVAVACAFALPASAQRNKGKDKEQDKGDNAILKTPDSIQSVKQAIADAYVGQTSACMKAKMFTEARAHLESAAKYVRTHPAIAAFAGKLDGEDGATDAAKKAYEAKLKSFTKSIDGLLAALLQAEIKEAKSGPILRTATTHMIEYLVSLPGSWAPGKKFPVLVTVEGAGCNWLGNHRGFNKGDLIVVTPITFANTNQLSTDRYNYPANVVQEHDGDAAKRIKFDEEGLLAILKDVGAQLGGEPKCFITGFSGGGNLTWRMVFGHPDLLRGAAPACANFANPGTISTAEERRTLPIRAFQGDKDEYLDGKAANGVNLNAEWERAKKACDDNGYTKVERRMLPGVGHSGCNNLVLEFVKEILAGDKVGGKK